MKKYVLLLLFAVLLAGLYYLVFTKDEWEEARPYFVSPTPISEKEKVSELEIRQLIERYLPQNVLRTTNDGKVFCSHKYYGFEEDRNTDRLRVYLYAHCEEYFLKGSAVVLGSGISHPVVLNFSFDDSTAEFLDIEVPQTGLKYADSVEKMFPEKYIRQVLEDTGAITISPSPKTQAENYYKGKLEVYF